MQTPEQQYLDLYEQMVPIGDVINPLRQVL